MSGRRELWLSREANRDGPVSAHAREEGDGGGGSEGKRATPSLVFSTICGRHGPFLGLKPSREALKVLDSREQARISGRVGH